MTTKDTIARESGLQWQALQLSCSAERDFNTPYDTDVMWQWRRTRSQDPIAVKEHDFIKHTNQSIGDTQTWHGMMQWRPWWYCRHQIVYSPIFIVLFLYKDWRGVPGRSNTTSHTLWCKLFVSGTNLCLILCLHVGCSRWVISDSRDWVFLRGPVYPWHPYNSSHTQQRQDKDRQALRVNKETLALIPPLKCHLNVRLWLSNSINSLIKLQQWLQLSSWNVWVVDIVMNVYAAQSKPRTSLYESVCCRCHEYVFNKDFDLWWNEL